MNEYYVYIMTNRSRTLYTGVTGDLEQRVLQHKLKLIEGFTSKYDINMLVWFEAFQDIAQAIESEKRIKAWRRSKKVELIEQDNPRWEDLAESWYTDSQAVIPRSAEESGPKPNTCSHANSDVHQILRQTSE